MGLYAGQRMARAKGPPTLPDSQSVKFEAVGRVSVGYLALKIRGQVDDGDGAEGALLGANTTTDA